MPETTLPGPEAAQFRGYLLFLAQLHWDARLNGHHDHEDLVQQTLQEAHQKWDQFKGTTEAELASWMRRILAHNMADAIRRIVRAKRNVNLERSLADAMESSSARLQDCLAADQSTPSARAVKNEQLARLTAALSQLSPLQREAVIRHHLQGIPLTGLAQEMNRSEASVAGLLRRGLAKLREFMGDQE